MADSQSLHEACKGLLQAGVPLAGCMVYVAMRSYQNQASGTAWPKQETVADQWHIPIRTLTRWLKVLEENGHVKAKRGQHGKVYTFPKVKGRKSRKRQKKTGQTPQPDMPHVADLSQDEAASDTPHMADLKEHPDTPHMAYQSKVMVPLSDTPHVASPDTPHMADLYKDEHIEVNQEKEKPSVIVTPRQADAMLDALVSKGKKAARKVDRDGRARR